MPDDFTSLSSAPEHEFPRFFENAKSKCQHRDNTPNFARKHLCGKHPVAGWRENNEQQQPDFRHETEHQEAIPEDSRPRKDQPFYHLLAENETSYYVAYVSEQNLVRDDSGEPVDHPDLPDLFGDFEDGRYPLQFNLN